MRIGIDGRLLSGRNSGARRYLQEILSVWSGSDTGDEFYIFTNQQISDDITLGDHFQVKVVPRKSQFLWTQGVLPGLLRKYLIDVFWGPNYALPLFGPSKTKYVITIHDMVSYVMPRTLPLRTVLHNRLLLPRYMKRIQYVIAVSQYTKRDIIRYSLVPSANIKVIHHGVHPRFGVPAESPPEKYKLGRPYILSVGAIEPRKNIEGVLRAFSRLCEDESFQHDLVIVGPDGWKTSRVYRTLRKTSALTKRVRLLGQVLEEDLPSLYQHASLFLYPSLYEGFGLPVVEAMRAGTPVITSNCSSLAEIADGAALLVSPQDTDSICQSIRRMLSDDFLRSQLRNAGKSRSDRFEWPATALQTLRVLREAGGDDVDESSNRTRLAHQYGRV